MDPVAVRVSQRYAATRKPPTNAMADAFAEAIEQLGLDHGNDSPREAVNKAALNAF